MNYRSIFTLAFLLVLLGALTTNAQTIPVGINGITIKQSSQNPVPGQMVTISAESYSFDIGSANISWSINGKVVEKGLGLTSLDVQAPALGKKTTILISALSANGAVFSNSLTLNSGSIDIVTETDGYVPPSFMGKIPFVFQNDLTLIAMPHLANSSGQEYDPKTLVYAWKKDDGTVFQNQSGYGKQALTLTGDLIPRPYYVTVTASTRDGSAQAETVIYVSGQSPYIHFYANDPLYGPLYNKMLGDTINIGSQKEADITAATFGFNQPQNSGSLPFTWLINNVEHPELVGSRSVALRSPDGISGTSNVQLSLQDTDKILQSARSGFTVMLRQIAKAHRPRQSRFKRTP